MYILLTSATRNEINTTIEWLKDKDGTVNGNEVEVLVTGIGSTAATYAMTRQFLWRSPELVIQAGIGGSFKQEYAPESVVFIGEEVFADLGAVENGELIDQFDLGLTANDEIPFHKRMLVNPAVKSWSRFGVPFVRGATVSGISSNDEQVDRILKKYDPVIESQEGAALHYTCLMEKIPFLQIRAVSNFAGERDKKKWKMKEAIAALNAKLQDVLNDTYP